MQSRNRSTGGTGSVHERNGEPAVRRTAVSARTNARRPTNGLRRFILQWSSSGTPLWRTRPDRGPINSLPGVSRQMRLPHSDLEPVARRLGTPTSGRHREPQASGQRIAQTTGWHPRPGTPTSGRHREPQASRRHNPTQPHGPDINSLVPANLPSSMQRREALRATFLLIAAPTVTRAARDGREVIVSGRAVCLKGGEPGPVADCSFGDEFGIQTPDGTIHRLDPTDLRVEILTDERVNRHPIEGCALAGGRARQDHPALHDPGRQDDRALLLLLHLQHHLAPPGTLLVLPGGLRVPGAPRAPFHGLAARCLGGEFRRPSANRVAPAQSGEPREVPVVRMQFRLVLDGKCRQVRVHHQ